jgi:1A family penicillin-binding protein
MPVALEPGVSSPALTAAQAKVRAYARSLDIFCQRHRRAVIGLAIVASSAVAVSGYLLWRIATEATVAASSFTLHTGAQATTLYDINDRQVFTLFTERRIDVPLSRVSPNLIAAVLAAEDRRFYEHRGFDLRRLAASGIANARARRYAQGASTITQQLVRMTSGNRDKTVTRKLREILTAAALERRYSKASILETYLNKVYLGEGFYGVEAAAYGYFGKTAWEVTPDEAATIAALIQSPTRYTKQELADRVRARRNWILQTMHAQQQIDAAAYRAAVDAPLRMNASATSAAAAEEEASNAAKKCEGIERRDCVSGTGLYFKEAVRRELKTLLPGSEVLSSGLRVYTTIDPAMQIAAEKALAERLAAMERAAAARANSANARKRQQRAAASAAIDVSEPPLQGSIVAIDPKTGYVKALVGGRNFTESSFDRARQARRQPGSAFKPFIYASALESGYTPGTMLHELDQPVEAVDGPYLPRGEHEATEMTVRRALTVSSNRAAVHMLQHVGMSTALHYAQRFGIESPLPAVPSLALGTGEVTLLELTSAYAVFANKGEYVEPTLIRRVESASGEVLYRASSSTRHVVSEDTAYLVTNMLSDVIQRGTANNVRRLGFTAPAAGKTGTTDDVADAWFVGYTPRLVAGVWVGYDDPRTIRKGKDAFASTIAVPVWTSFMTAAIPQRQGQGRKGERDRVEQFEAPAGLEKVAYCPISGEPAGPNCQLAQEARVRDAIVVTTDPVTGTPMATNVASATDESEPKPELYYDIARPSETMQRCSLHAEWNPSDAAPAYRAAESRPTYPATGYPATSYQAPSYQSPSYQAPRYPAPSASPASNYRATVRTYDASSYGVAATRGVTAPAVPTPGVTTPGPTTRGVTVAAPSTGTMPAPPPSVNSDSRATTTIESSNGVTRVIVRTPGSVSAIPATPAKPMMSPADAANVIRRP